VEQRVVTAVAAGPLRLGAQTLSAALSARFGRPVPVLPLGAADTLLHPEHDPDAPDRRAARVQLTAASVLIGPWGATGPCGNCVATRWQRLRAGYLREALEFGSGTTAAGDWPLVPAHLTDAVAALYAETVLGERRTEQATVSQLDLATLQLRSYPLLADPLCPSCGDDAAEPVGPRSLAVPSTPKPDPDADRLHRSADYRLPAAALVNPVTGLLGPLATKHLTTTTTAPVFGSILMHGDSGLSDMTWCGQTNSYGESADIAYLEGLERYAGTRRRSRAEPVTASLTELLDSGQPLLDPRDCGVYSAQTYAHDPRLEPFDPRARIPWVWGYSLRDQRSLLVPARLVYYSAGTHEDNFIFECSNGCASGAGLAEAVLFGLLELIERDAFLLAWYAGLDLTPIAVEAADNPVLAAMLDRADLRGYEVRLFDNRIDLEVPVVTAVAVRRDGGDGALSFAAAASLDPATAVRGAVAEILTYIPELPQRLRTRRTEIEAMAGDFGLVRKLRDHAELFALPAMREHAGHYLRPADPVPMSTLYQGWERPRTGDQRDDVAACVDRLAAAGHDVIVVDQTAPEQRELGLVTVATIVPGLLPIDFGWSQQRALLMPRTRTAPHRAGLRAAELTEQDLHRVPHPFP
jgi:ribosomal protein S12 methylthiotransferase accessory factor